MNLRQNFTRMKVFGLVAGGFAALGAQALRFGPKHCVSVYRNEDTQTCVLETDCADDVNLENVEFAFTCKLDKMVQKHSFGKGGFDNQEKFDTSVKCNACGLPDEVAFSLQKAKEEPKEEVEEKKEVPASAATVKFGPDNCVSTWVKNDAVANKDGESGVCQVKTECSKVGDIAFEQYPVGLICMNKDKIPVRHLFGSNSFDKTEEFNTLIRCTECLGLDEVSENVTLQATVKGLSKILTDVANEVEEVDKKVSKLVKPEEKEATEAAPTEFMIKRHAPPAAEEEVTEEQAEDSTPTVVEDVYDEDA